MTDETLLVCEQFYSIQGESTWAGFPCLFIRMAGCNLRCNYCDSAYTWEEPGKEVSLDKLLAWVEEYPGVLVELTGGEPLLQENVYLLIKALLEKERTLLIETNGSIVLDRVPHGAHIILDIKCPGSGMEQSNNWDNIQLLESRSQNGCADEIKFVLSGADDFYWAMETVKKQRLNEITKVLFSPNETMMSARELAELILQNSLPVRLQLQLHKSLWPDMDRGV